MNLIFCQSRNGNWDRTPKTSFRRFASVGAALSAVLFLAGCVGTPRSNEVWARQDVGKVSAAYRPGGGRPVLPELTTNASLADFARYAMLNQPTVEASYYDWAASVEKITTERSLPDPQLTFQTFNTSTLLSSLMFGLVTEFPGPGKLDARAAVASAESDAKYFAFESSVLEAVFGLKKAYYNLYFLDAQLRIKREMAGLLSDLEQIARSQNEVGAGVMPDVLRAQMELEQTLSDVTNLEDSRALLNAQFKAALGLPAAAPAPPLPAVFESTPLDLTSDQLFAEALAHNPQLKAMEADVRMAQAGINAARKDRVPDFNAGLSADVKAVPVMWNPQAGMTLPIWRDKLAAEIAAAQAAKRAAEARLSAGQINLAVEFAEKSYMFRESGRNLELLRHHLLPKAEITLQLTKAAHHAAQMGFLDLIDAERELLKYKQAEVDAEVQRELALADLSSLILGRTPPDAPVLEPGRKN
jgi:outer membrane protein TolC